MLVRAIDHGPVGVALERSARLGHKSHRRDTVEGQQVVEWYKEAGGDDVFALPKDDPRFIEGALAASGNLKAIVQSVQSPATGYLNLMGYHLGLTQPQIDRDKQLAAALDEVLDHPRPSRRSSTRRSSRCASTPRSSTDG